MNSNSPTAVCLVGLPGSGKTWVAEHEYVPQGYVLVDDPGTPNGTPVEKIQEALAAGRNVVLTDPNLCFPEERALAEGRLRDWGAGQVEWVFFENESQKAHINLGHRFFRQRVFRDINLRIFAERYEIPEGVKPRRIWNPPVRLTKTQYRALKTVASSLNLSSVHLTTLRSLADHALAYKIGGKVTEKGSWTLTEKGRNLLVAELERREPARVDHWKKTRPDLWWV